MELVTLGLSVTTIAMVPLGAAVKQSWGHDTRITTLEANYQNLDRKLSDVSGKLDRLIERFLPD